mgnify:CR=1 FL=1
MKGGIKMAKFNKGNIIGSWAFLIGVILAIVVGGLGFSDPIWAYVLVLIGIVVGFFNINDEEVSPFLMSGAVLIIASAFGMGVMGTIPLLGGILSSMLTIFVPATIIVAIKNVFTLARK